MSAVEKKVVSFKCISQTQTFK